MVKAILAVAPLVAVLAKAKVSETTAHLQIAAGDVSLKKGSSVDVSHAHTMLSELQEAIDSRVDAKAGSGPPLAPLSQTIADAIYTQFDELEAFLLAEQVSQQLVATDSNDRIEACNSQVGGNLVTAGTLHDDVVTKRGQHKSCRETAHENMETAGIDCGAYYAAGTSFVQNAPDCMCDYTSGSTVENMDNKEQLKGCFLSSQAWINSHADFVTKQGTCETSEEVFDLKNVACDAKQKNFETAFCNYAGKLTDTCSSYRSCMSPAEQPTLDEQHAAEKLNVDTLVSAHIAAYKATKTARCLLALLTQSGITQAQVDTCASLTIDTAHLNVDYPDKVDGDGCDEAGASPKPGEDAWNNQEYENNLDWEQLVSDTGVACSA